MISSWGGARRAHPYAFTEQGVAMLSSVLNSKRAIQVNIAIMRAIVRSPHFSGKEFPLLKQGLQMGVAPQRIIESHRDETFVAPCGSRGIIVIPYILNI